MAVLNTILYIFDQYTVIRFFVFWFKSCMHFSYYMYIFTPFCGCVVVGQWHHQPPPLFAPLTGLNLLISSRTVPYIHITHHHTVNTNL